MNPSSQLPSQPSIPRDAQARRAVPAVECYPLSQTLREQLEERSAIYAQARETLTKIAELKIPPRQASCFRVKAGEFFRICSIEGPQVGDLNLWADDPQSPPSEKYLERFYSGKTRALHGTHLSTDDRLWSSFPYLRAMATITYDSLAWYGVDEYGTSVHDVIGTRCDPYTHNLLTGGDYHYCCHSNLTKALAESEGLTEKQAEAHVHDVLNVFMCTGFHRRTKQYLMKASPVRPGDYLEFYAEIDLLAALSTCPGGDCSAQHSSDVAKCYPLLVEIYQANHKPLNSLKPPAVNGYRWE